MYKNIYKLDFSKLRKLEVRILANRVIETVEKFDPEAIKIKEGFDLLVAKEPQIDLLDVGPGPHPLTPELQALRKKRRAIGRGIVEQVRSIVDSKIKGTDKEIDVVNRAVNQYMKDIWYKDDATIHEKVDLFFKFYSRNEELSLAATSLDLENYLDNLKAVNNLIERKYSARRSSISARPKTATLDIVSDLKGAIEYLFKQIEVAQVVNHEFDYTLLVDDLNKEIATWKATINTRTSYSKKRAEEALKNDKVDETGNDVVESIPEGPSENNQPIAERMLALQVGASTNGNGVSDETLGLLDKKKTAAVSTKQVRLPNVSDEA